MLRLMTDEDFNGHIVRGVLRSLPTLDLMRIQDLGLLSASDPEVLEAAATAGRILLTHDSKTMPLHAYDRAKAGQSFPGMCVCPQRLAIGVAIEEIALLAECSEEDELVNKVVYLPL